jgi:hypothetical protein
MVMVTNAPRKLPPDLSHAPYEMRGPYREPVEYKIPEPRSTRQILRRRFMYAVAAAVVLYSLIAWGLA